MSSCASAAFGEACRVYCKAADEPLPRVHTDEGNDAGFITTTVMRDFRRAFVFAGGVFVALWGEPSAAQQ